MADRWDQAKALFHAARERDAAGRASLLDQACADDPQLRHEVDSLLAAHDGADGFLASPLTALAAGMASVNAEARLALADGTRLGPYEVLSLLACGGMGQVYRARDTRLGRLVAVKVLPPGVAGDADRVRRFEQEVQSASALNHPNILTVFDVGAHSGAPYLVTELLDGRSLAEVLREQRLPVAQALDYALQIARGLSAAHAKGIVHRDLKPPNLFVTTDGAVKILDFGLARLAAHVPADGARAGGPLTQEGVVLGTVGYMAPEQVRGEAADRRSDIFSFGTVLYEMLAGQRAFARDTAAETMTAILREEPAPLAELCPEVSPAIVRLLGRCLAKRPEDRFGSGREALFVLEVAATAPDISPVLPPDRAPRLASLRHPAWLAAAILGASLAAAALLALVARERPMDRRDPVVSALILPARAGSLLRWNGVPDIALSPDGSRLAYVGVGADRRPALWMRDLASTTVRQLTGTANAFGPFWSPDGRFLAFFADDKLKRAPADGGTVQTLCDSGEPARGMGGGSWNRDGVILFSTGDSVARVPATGGNPQAVRRAEAGELHLRFPSFLPDGRRFLYLARRDKGPDRVYVGSLDASEAPALVHEGQSRAVFSRGHLLFIRDGVLLAQPFDDRALRPMGDPQPIAPRVANLTSNGRAGFSVSANGVLTYVENAALSTELVWKDRHGRMMERLTNEGHYLGPALAPDGRRLVVEVEDTDSGQHSVWILGPARGVQARLTRPPNDGHHPQWAPDGRQIAFSSTRTGKWLSYRGRTDGLGEDVLLYDNPDVSGFYTRQWTRDGRAVVLMGLDRDSRTRLWLVPVGPGEQARPLVDGLHGALSPDGRWLAVASKQTGRYEIYVLPFPTLDTRWQVSVNGGSWPRWRADGREIFYVSEDRKLMSVPVAAGDGFEAEPPAPLFPLSLRPTDSSAVWPHEYDVDAKGERFIICQVPEDAAPSSITHVSDWVGLLRTR